MMVWKMIFLFQGCILRFHVNLPGCIYFLTTPTPQTASGAQYCGVPTRVRAKDAPPPMAFSFTVSPVARHQRAELEKKNSKVLMASGQS